MDRLVRSQLRNITEATLELLMVPSRHPMCTRITTTSVIT